MIDRIVPGFLLGLLLVCGCRSLPPVTEAPVHRIYVGDGPEDMVLDSWSSSPRLLISCDDRRKEGGAPFSGIVAYDLGSGKVDTLERKGEPVEFFIHPHGIFLQEVDDVLRLYMISHQVEIVGRGPKEMQTETHQYVIRYRVEKDHLVYERTFESPHFRSPNALLVQEDGSFFVSNDAYKRGNVMEMALGRKVSELVYCDAEGECEVVEDRVGFGNGVQIRDGYLYQAATRDNAIYRYKLEENGDLSEKEIICKLKGPDNLRFFGDDLLVVCHERPFAFMRHIKDSDNPSPTVVYRFSPELQEPGLIQASLRCIFSDDGHRISAGSTAIIYDENLYVSQVLEPYIVKVKLITAPLPEGEMR